ncbi:MAG TPA: VOC family protein [Candidatus Saccharimonadales bacterium]|nr:VOC family protein [Candidatus Saccharimonadales bacterium]
MNFKTVFSGFSVDNIAAAKEFYVEMLGLGLKDETMGLSLSLPGGGEHFVYEKPDHSPATFTVLNFVVENIDTAMDELMAKGITFERYNLGDGAEQDEKGVLRGLAANMGPDIAWFKDPAGNILAVLQPV